MPLVVPSRITVQKYILFWSLFVFLSTEVVSQNTLLLEKVGTKRKFFFRVENKFQLRTTRPDTFLIGHLWDIGEKNLTLQTYIPLTVPYENIKFVYKSYKFPRKFGIYCMIFAGVSATVITINHLVNNEQVFTPDMAYICLPFLGVGIISLSFSRERMKIGTRWKLKVLDMPVFPLDGK
ncbi:MAG: hypothetical protein NTU51_09750 [Bacteroidetes bacterium]|nr:hypothetical protein [Bacteroidota bacterium]